MNFEGIIKNSLYKKTNTKLGIDFNIINIEFNEELSNLEEKKIISYDYFVDDPDFFLYDDNDDYEYRIYKSGWETGVYENNNYCISNEINSWRNISENLVNNKINLDCKENEENSVQNKIKSNKLIRKVKLYRESPKVRFFDVNEETKILEEEPKKKKDYKIKANLIKPDPLLFLKDIIQFKTSKVSVVLKCKFCNKSDHLTKDCKIGCTQYDLCHLCFQSAHEVYKCPLQPCLRCNRLGHKTSECQTTNEIQKCLRCRHVNHLAEDCLLNPINIKKEILEMSKCFFCKKLGHLICPIKDNFIFIKDDLDLSYDSEQTEIGLTNKNKYIEEKEENKNNFKIEIYCPKCAGNHLLKECGKSTTIITKDKIRINNATSFFSCGPSKLAQDKNFLGDSSDSD